MLLFPTPWNAAAVPLHINRHGSASLEAAQPTDTFVSSHFQIRAGRKVISADTRIVKIWGATDGAPYTSIEPPGAGDINDVCVWPNCGCGRNPKEQYCLSLNELKQSIEPPGASDINNVCFLPSSV